MRTKVLKYKSVNQNNSHFLDYINTTFFLLSNNFTGKVAEKLKRRKNSSPAYILPFKSPYKISKLKKKECKKISQHLTANSLKFEEFNNRNARKAYQMKN